MTKSEFRNWERRQASLTALGWRVLRFANADVLDHQDKCADHVSLLLKKRKKAGHQKLLKASNQALEKRLQEAEKAAIEFQGQSSQERELASAKIESLREELAVLRK